MAGVLLENLSKRQACLFAFLCVVLTVIFFILGGTKVSSPANASIHIATGCKADKYGYKNRWYRRTYFSKERPVIDREDANCTEVDITGKDQIDTTRSVVLSVHMPHPPHNFSRYNQFMSVSMNAELDSQVSIQHPQSKLNCIIHYTAKLGFKEHKGDPWQLYAESTEARPLQCLFTSYRSSRESTIKGQKVEGYYTCEDMHFLELGSIHHAYYLINLQFSSKTKCPDAKLVALHFVEIHQNGLYTLAWFTAKTVVTPFLLAALVFFYKRVKRHDRAPLLLEKAILGLGISLLILVIPIEWLTLVFDMPVILLLSDIRQGQFYAMLLSFWCLFAGEHILDQRERGNLKAYKWQLGCVLSGCAALILFDLAERGVQLHNPFHTIWKKDNGETVAKGFIIFASIAAVIYGIFFITQLIRVFYQMKLKGDAMPVMQDARRLYYQGIIKRFRALVIVTLFCGVVTVVCFVLDQINETSWKFLEDNYINDYIKVSSALHFGTFGLWNVYVIAILILYSPDSQTQERSQRVLYTKTTHDDTDDDSKELSIDATSGSAGDSVSMLYTLAGQHPKS